MGNTITYKTEKEMYGTDLGIGAMDFETKERINNLEKITIQEIVFEETIKQTRYKFGEEPIK